MCDLNRSVSRSRGRGCSICPQAARHSVTAAFIIDFITTISQPLKITLWSLDITLCRTLFLRPLKLSVTVHAAARGGAIADTHQCLVSEKKRDKKQKKTASHKGSVQSVIHSNPTVIQIVCWPPVKDA